MILASDVSNKHEVQPLLQNEGAKGSSSTIHKMNRAWDTFINYTAVAALALVGVALLPVTVTVLAGCRLYSYVEHKVFSDSIDKERIATLKESLTLILTGDYKGTQSSNQTLIMQQQNAKDLADDLTSNSSTTPELAKDFAEKVIALRDRIEGLGSGDLDSFRADLGNLLEHDVYKSLKNRDFKTINFLQILSIKLVSGNGRKSLEDLGAKWTGLDPSDKETKLHAGDLSTHLRKYLYSNQMSFHRDNAVGTVVWGLTHPLRAINCAISHFFPLHYNSHYENPSYLGYTFELDGKEIDFYYGPGPTGDSVFKNGLLPAYEKFGISETRANYQDLYKKDERARIVEVHAWSEEVKTKDNPPLQHAVFGFDTKARNFKKDFTNAKEFFTKYKDFLKDNNDHRTAPAANGTKPSGMYIPTTLLSEPEFDRALKFAEKFFTDLSENDKDWASLMKSNEGKERLAKMMMLGTDAFLSLAILYQTIDAIGPNETTKDRDLATNKKSGACKQDIDRGPMQNVAEQMFFELTKSGDGFSIAQVCQWFGAVAGRARVADDRNLMDNRYDILDDLLQFIDGKESSAHKTLSNFRAETQSVRHDIINNARLNLAGSRVD